MEYDENVCRHPLLNANETKSDTPKFRKEILRALEDKHGWERDCGGTENDFQYVRRVQETIGLHSEMAHKEWHKIMTRYPTVRTKSDDERKKRKRLTCAICGQNFYNQKLLEKHRQESARCLKTWKNNANKPYFCSSKNCGRVLIGIQNYEKHINYHCHDRNVFRQWMTSDDRRYGNNVGVPKEDEKQFRGNIYYSVENGEWRCTRCGKTADAYNVKGLIHHMKRHRKEMLESNKELDKKRFADPEIRKENRARIAMLPPEDITEKNDVEGNGNDPVEHSPVETSWEEYIKKYYNCMFSREQICYPMGTDKEADFSELRDKRLELNEEWKYNYNNGEWKIHRWNGKNSLTETNKTVDPMEPRIEKVDTYQIPKTIAWRNTEKSGDKRLWRKEFWRKNKNGHWKIYEHVHGILYEVEKHYNPQYPIVYLGDDNSDEEEEHEKEPQPESFRMDLEDQNLYEEQIMTRKEVVIQNRLEMELQIKRIYWDTNTGTFQCNLCTALPEGTHMEEVEKLFRHISNCHEKLAGKKKVYCPYCPAHYCTKDTLVIHVGLKNQRGNGCYRIKKCVALPTQDGKTIWDDLLEKNGKTKDRRTKN